MASARNVVSTGLQPPTQKTFASPRRTDSSTLSAGRPPGYGGLTYASWWPPSRLIPVPGLPTLPPRSPSPTIAAMFS